MKSTCSYCRVLGDVSRESCKTCGAPVPQGAESLFGALTAEDIANMPMSEYQQIAPYLHQRTTGGIFG